MCTGVAVGERQAGYAGSGVGGRARLILLLGGLIALGPLSIDLYLPALPGIAHDMRAGDAGVQFTLTGMLAGLALGQMLVGPLSDALGRRRPLIQLSITNSPETCRHSRRARAVGSTPSQFSWSRRAIGHQA
jgi:MFS family permease